MAKYGGEKRDDIITEAIERFKESQDGSDYNRETAEEDIAFGRLGEQWPETIKEQRKKESRPCLTINKIPAFVRQVVNDARQNKPSIVVSPVDNGADEDTAEVINGLVRAIQRNSNADVAYDTGLDHSVSGGFGFFEIDIDYVSDDSFDQQILIKRIANPLMVHWDITTTEFDASDWNYGFISDFIEEEEYRKRYPGAEEIDFENDTLFFHENFVESDVIQVAKYYLKEDVSKQLLMLSDGTAVQQDKLVELVKEILSQWNKEAKGMSDEELIGLYLELTGTEVTKERDVTGSKVMRRIISGVEVLEETEWPSNNIPICPVWGEEIMLRGRRYFRSMIRDACDSQRMFNYWRSATTELVALTPKAPWVGPEGFIPKGQEKKWEHANTRSYPYLEYRAGLEGKPERQPFSGVPAGALQEALNASDDMKAIIGIYDPSLGARSNETSGRAILARQREADVSNFHFIDNLSRAIQYAGRCIVDLIPSVYKDRQVLRILGEDQKEKIIKLGQGESKAPDGTKLYDLSVGRYDVTVKAGPSYASQREETRETLIEIIRGIGDSGQYLADILFEHMDFQGADKVAKRARLLLPPQVQQMEAQENQSDMPPEMQEMMMQSQATIQQLQQQIQQLQSEREPEMAKFQLEQGKAQEESAMKQRELDLKQQEMDLKWAEFNRNAASEDNQAESEGRETSAKESLADSVMSLVNQQDQLLRILETPLRIEKDDEGRITGVVRAPEESMEDEFEYEESV